MNCYEIYFSPTGGTQKVARILAKGMGTKFTEIDMIKYPDKEQLRGEGVYLALSSRFKSIVTGKSR